MPEPIVFLNIGWMKRYQGPTADDQLQAGHFSYFKKNKPSTGHEQWNFLPRAGEVVGYVPRSAGINIQRLGAARSANELTGVLAVFMARDPQEKQTKVVGWYRNATVRGSASFKRTVGGITVEAPVKTRAKDAVLLPVSRRTIVVPTAQRVAGGMGQSPVWYATEHPDLIAEVRGLVGSFDSAGPAAATATRTGPRNQNVKLRLEVEKVAMDLALAYFENAVAVPLERRGWDIEAIEGARKLYIEVKGLSGPVVSIQLTPNEYEKMRIYKDDYIVFVVTNALSDSKRLARVFRCSAQSSSNAAVWTTADGQVLNVQERTGAIGTL